MDLKDYWRSIRRRWKTVVVCLLLGIGAAAVITWQTTPLYASTARLFIATPSSNNADASAGGQFATQRVASYAEIVNTSQSLAETVAANLGGSIPVGDVEKSISASSTPETVILEITATDADPVQARDIAQAYAEALSQTVAKFEAPTSGRPSPIKASISDAADLPTAPVSPSKVRNLTYGVLIGLVLGLGLALLRDLFDNSVSTSEDVAEVTATPILGHINSDSTAVKKAPAEALAEATPWAESFRVLRTNMQYVDVDHERRVFVVSSSLPAEGKSTASANLAVTLSLAGQRVALVECDLRRPTMAGRLGLDDAVGTTSVLIGRVALDDAIQTLDGTDLSVVTCGPRPPNPSELLQSFAMEKLITELRDRFDVVLLDAPPLLPVTDAALLAARADGMITVIRHGKTTRDQLRHALERVESVGARVVGVVINMAPARRAGRSYGGYGYGYGYTEKPVKGAGRRKAAAVATDSSPRSGPPPVDGA